MNKHLSELTEILDEECKTNTMVCSTTALMLKRLECMEKEILAVEFLKWSWNIGSTKVLCWFQRANILSATEYIAAKSESDPDEVQLILNDFFETEFALLANLFRSAECQNFTSTKISECLNKSLECLCIDLCANPNLIKTNYLHEMESLLLPEEMVEVCMLHSKIFLENSQQNMVEEAIRDMHIWNREADDSENVLNEITRSIAKQSNNTIWANLIQYSQLADFRCWKYYLLLLKYMAINSCSQKILKDLKGILKAYVKTMFRDYLDGKLDWIFYALMITARQICFYNDAILGSYSIWYKQTIGEMKYTLKPDEFNTVMKTLINMLEHETNVDVLKTHINMSIPAPTFCNEIVLNYKQVCRSRLCHCIANANNSNGGNENKSEAMDVYVIDA